MNVSRTRRSISIGFLFCIASGSAFAEDNAQSVTIWNPTTASNVIYKQLTPDAKAGDWVYVDANKVHPTQICLGYRESGYRAKELSELNTDLSSKDPNTGLYPHLAKKDVPIIIAPDGTPYITDGHHTLSGLLESSQKDKRGFGHVVASFFGQPETNFLAYITDPAKNDCYLYGPAGNGFTGMPGPMQFSELPRVLTGADMATRMPDDPYRSLAWAMKGSGFTVKKKGADAEDPLMENFVEFRWADLFRNKIVWNDKSDASFSIAVANAEALAHSEINTDLTGGFSSKDRPGFVAAKAEESFVLNITNETYITGDIDPAVESTNTLNVNAAANTSLIIPGRLNNFAKVTINAGGSAEPVIEQGKVNANVKIPAGAGTVILPAKSKYKGSTEVAAGNLVVNGAIAGSAVTVDAHAILSGSGKVGVISGPGLVSPGSGVGIMTATSINPSAGTGFAFELTTASQPDWSHPLKSRNDVVSLQSNTPFASALTSRNPVKVYLNIGKPHDGDTFIGGFFVDPGSSDSPNTFESAIASADHQYYLVDGGGSENFGGVKYTRLDASAYEIVRKVISCEAGFTATAVHGYVTAFTIHFKSLAH